MTEQCAVSKLWSPLDGRFESATERAAPQLEQYRSARLSRFPQAQTVVGILFALACLAY